MYTTQNKIIKLKKRYYSCVFLQNGDILELKALEIGLSNYIT